MFYSEFVDLYESLSKTTKRLEKVTLLATFLKNLKAKGKSKWIYLLNGKVAPDYDSREFGISRQLAFKVISSSFGVGLDKVIAEFNKIGDLGEIAENFSNKRRQSNLFSKRLSVDKVFDNLVRVMDVEGKGAVEKKVDFVSELLSSASGKEAKYIVRTLLGDLRVGVAEGILRDSLSEAFFGKSNEATTKIEEAQDLVNDLAIIFEKSSEGIQGLEEVNVSPGRPMKVMLAVKVENIKEAFDVCGKPAAFEYKYDGFRMLINKKDGKVSLFTRKLENVTAQFPDVVSVVEKNIKGDSFVLDSEVVGYDKKKGKYLPFEAISQRIKRKYDIEELVNKVPVEVNIFDVVYHNGENFMRKSFKERRKLVEKIIKEEEWKIRVSQMLITDSEEKAQEFYQEALDVGQEGVMIKNITAPYKQGRRVGFMAKLKPVINDLDLVVVGAEYGSGKRAGWLTSYIVACRDDDDGKLLEVGKVSSGLKEKEEEGTSYDEFTKMLNELIVEKKGNTVEVKPKIVVSVTYQNIQPSPSYSSGFALRFPRISAYRPDRTVSDIASLKDIEMEASKAL